MVTHAMDNYNALQIMTQISTTSLFYTGSWNKSLMKRAFSNCPQELMELVYLIPFEITIRICIHWDPYQIKDISNLKESEKKDSKIIQTRLLKI